MDSDRSNPSRTTFPGRVMHLGGGHRVVLHIRDELAWVAEFRDGRAQLVDAATWWRQVPPPLGSPLGRANALRNLGPLSPEVQRQVEQLHEERHQQWTQSTGAALWADIRRCFGAMLRAMRCATAGPARRPR